MNIPYVKKYDQNGVLTNPINGKYENLFPNRQKRKAQFSRYRFLNNKKSHQLVVRGIFAYFKTTQLEWDKEGKRKVIEHYIPKQRK